MSISSVSSSSWLSQLSQSTSQTGQSRPAPPSGPPPGGGGKMMSAISSALSELGLDTSSISGTGSTDSASSTDETSDPSQALGAFMQTLMSSLRAQSSGNDAESDSDSSTAIKAHKGPPDIAADLQSLMKKLQSGDTTSSDDGTSDLESSFKNLVSSLGGDASSASLGDFLSALSSKLPDMSSKGSLVQTQA